MTNENFPGDQSLVSPKEELEKLIKSGEISGSIKVETLFRNPEKSQYQISPNGKVYSYLAPYQRRKNIYIVEVNSEGEGQRITEVDDRNISQYFWGNDQQLLFLKDSKGDENFHLYTVDIITKKTKNLTPFSGVRVEIIDSLRHDDQHVLIGMNKNNPGLFEPFRLNIESGELERMAVNVDPANPLMGWTTNHEGKILLAQKIIDGVNHALMYRASEEEEFSEILRTDFKSELRPLFFDFDHDDIIYAASNLGRDKLALVKFNLATGKEIEEVFVHDSVDISHASYSKLRKKITGVSYITNKSKYHLFDEETKGHYDVIESKCIDLEWALVSRSKDELSWIIRTYSDKSLGDYYLYTCSDQQWKHIAEVSPWLYESDMSSQLPIKYQSKDGLEIHGYLTLPQDRPGPHPMIVNPHGGPWHRDTWGFNPEVQLFASRGYAVLQMNFRGSVGYGRKFWESSFKQWGQKMQEDITDGVNWAIENGHAQKDDINIYGGSYGGYATLAGLCYTPELYRCGIDYVGVSNLFTFMKTIPPYWEPYLKMMYEMVGDPELDREMMEAYSPALHSDKIQVPLFVIQGANDPRVDIDESDQIVRSLRSRNVDVPYMVKYDEGHGFQNEENRFEVYKAMLGFLKK